MNKQDKIITASPSGSIGSALVQNFREQGYTDIFDLGSIASGFTEEAAVVNFLTLDRPDYTPMGSNDEITDLFFPPLVNIVVGEDPTVGRIGVSVPSISGCQSHWKSLDNAY